jgi:hypothetical protein
MGAAEIRETIESHLSGTNPTTKPEMREPSFATGTQVVVEAQLDGKLRYMRIAEVTSEEFAGWWWVRWGEYPVGGGNGFDATMFGPIAHVLRFLDVWIATFGPETDLPPLPRDEVERRMRK